GRCDREEIPSCADVVLVLSQIRPELAGDLVQRRNQRRLAGGDGALGDDRSRTVYVHDSDDDGEALPQPAHVPLDDAADRTPESDVACGFRIETRRWGLTCAFEAEPDLIGRHNGDDP